MTDTDGTLTETYTYDSFGTLTYIQSLNEDGVLAEAEDTLSRFLYAGEQYDDVVGMYYLRARRYDTTVGRFTQEDTYLGDGRNLYVYVQSNPLKYVDPSGYSSKNMGYLGYYSMYDSSNPEKVNELGWFSHGDIENEAIDRVGNSYNGKIWNALSENAARATDDFAIGIFYEIAYLASFGFYHDPESEKVYYQEMFQAGRDAVDFVTMIPGLMDMATQLSNDFWNFKVPASNTNVATTSQSTSLTVQDQGLNVITMPSYYPMMSSTSTLIDWTNRIPDLSKQAPIEIPSTATIKVQEKNGYDQISFKWTENGQNYEVRWHTKTPGAPEGQGNTWVVSRVTPGTSTGQVRVEHILVGDTWIPRYQWQDAINAYKNGTATQEQLQLLKDGHWQAP